MKKFLFILLLVMGSACGGESRDRFVNGYKLETGVVLRNVDLGVSDLKGVDMSYADLRFSNFSSVDFTGANLSHSNLTGANFYGADLSGVDLRGADLTGASFIYANFSGANLGGAKWEEADFRGAYLYTAGMPESYREYWAENGIGNTWRNENIQRSTFSYSEDWTRDITLGQVVFFGLLAFWLLGSLVILLSKKFGRVESAIGRVADLLPLYKVSHAFKCWLAKKSKNDLKGAELKRAHMSGADLSNSDLRSARLRGAHMVGADLRDVDLTGVDLRDANLTGANLRHAILDETDLLYVKWPEGWKLVRDE